MRKKVVAIACSDLHLSLKPPVARAGEPDWLEAQKRPLKQLNQLAQDYKAPILCAGDVFDRWNSPPELINWAIEHLPKMYAIPGQHDLPLHNHDLVFKSAFYTLVMEGTIQCLPHGGGEVSQLYVHPHRWGESLKPLEEEANKTGLNIALIHQYLWVEEKTYPGAPKEAHVKTQMKKFEGWDVVIYGDNHKSFLVVGEDFTVFNCGGLQRRKSDEIDYRPQVGLIYSDGSVEPHYLDCSLDIIQETQSARESKDDLELKDFLEELTKLQDSELDFKEAMKQVMAEKDIGPLVKELILEAMNESN